MCISPNFSEVWADTLSINHNYNYHHLGVDRGRPAFVMLVKKIKLTMTHTVLLPVANIE